MKYLLLVLASLLILATAKPVQAVCPVCTVAVGAGLGASRLIGIDDSVTGLWIGGLILSSGLWIADFVKKRNWKLPLPTISSIVIMTLFVVPPLYWSQLIGQPGNTLWGIDKVILGTLIGSAVFLLGVGLDKFARSTHQGRVYIYYQKVIIPVFLLSIFSFVLYRITS